MDAFLKRDNAGAAIGWGGLIAGTLDLLAAFLLAAMRHVGPDRVLHYIASGLLGTPAFIGGVPTGALGLLCHFVIAYAAAAIYWLFSRRMRVLITRPILSGLLYGALVYAVTNLIVVPLSKIGSRPLGPPSAIATGVIVLMLFVGLPIALATRRYSR